MYSSHSLSLEYSFHKMHQLASEPPPPCCLDDYYAVPDIYDTPTVIWERSGEWNNPWNDLMDSLVCSYKELKGEATKRGRTTSSHADECKVKTIL